MKTAKRIGEIAILVIAVFYIAKTLSRNWPSVAAHLHTANWWLLLAGWCVFLVYFVLRATAWQLLMKSLGATIRPTEAARIWFLSEFSRYVPGNVWSFLGRVHLSEKSGVPRRITLVGLIIEIFMLLGSAALFVIIFFLAMPYANLTGLRWLGLLAIPAIALLITPSLLEKLSARLFKLLKKEPVPFSISRRQLIVITLTFLAAWTAYGFASYLVAIAFTSITASAWWLVSAFVVAWLLGYVSFITPMGLGVREGAVIAFLTPVIGVGLAGLIAIATRVGLIISELSVLAAIGLLKLKRHWTEYVLALSMFLFIVYNGAFSFLRQANFLTGRFDLGIMDQTVWNTANGHFFQLIDPNGWYGEVSRFSIHADTLLILLAPLYRIYASPYVLLGVQVIAAAFGALGLYLLGKQILKNQALALLPAIAYLLFPPLQNAVGFEFHAETVITSCLIFAFYFLYNRRYLPFAVFALLALTGKETMAFTVAMLGVYALWTHRNKWVGMATIAVSALWFYVLLWHIMPGSRSDGAAHFALSYYSQFGSTPEQIIRTLAVHPQTWIHQLTLPEQTNYLFYFVLPTAFLALLSPAILLLALPELMLNLLSNNQPMHTIIYQYAGAITPFAFIAMTFGLARLHAWIAPRLKTYAPAVLTVLCVVCLGFATYHWSALPGMQQANTLPFTTYLPAGVYLDTLAKSIPKNASVSATDHLASHFSEREYIYPFPQAVGEADYLIIKDDDDILGFVSREDMQAQIQSIRNDSRYSRIYQNGTVEVFQKINLNINKLPS